MGLRQLPAPAVWMTRAHTGQVCLIPAAHTTPQGLPNIHVSHSSVPFTTAGTAAHIQAMLLATGSGIPQASRAPAPPSLIQVKITDAYCRTMALLATLLLEHQI